MAKLTLTDPTTLIGLPTTISNNNTLIEQAVENTLSRDGTSPNEMNADLDMNDQKIYNLPEATTDSEPVRKKEFDEGIAANFPLPDHFYATDSDAEAGTSETLIMTPATVKHVNDLQSAALSVSIFDAAVAQAEDDVTDRIASDAETIAGTDPDLLVSPAGLAAAFDVEGQEIIESVLASLPDASAGYADNTIEDKTYALIGADGGIIADHGWGDSVQFDDNVEMHAYESARRRLDSKFVSTTLMADPAGVNAKLSNVKISKDGAVLAFTDETGAEYTSSAGGAIGSPVIIPRLYYDDTLFYAGSNDAATPSMDLLRNNVMDCFWLFGQSYVAGAGGAQPEIEAYSTTARDAGWAFMPAEGLLRSPTTAQRLGSSGITDLRSIQVYNADGNRIIGETVAPEAAHTILAGQMDAFGVKTPQFWHGTYRGGWPWNVLGLKGSPQRKNLLYQADWNRKNIKKAGYRAVPRAIFVLQGEEDYNTDPDVLFRIYHNGFMSLRRELGAVHGVSGDDIKIIFMAPMRGPFSTSGKNYVCCSSIAFQRLNDTFPDIYCLAGANYEVSHLAAHPTIEPGDRQLGAILGRAALRHVYGQGNHLAMRIMGDVIRLAADKVRVLIRVPNGGSLQAQAMDVGPIGNPSDDTLANYIGPNMPTEGAQRFGGIWDTNETGDYSSAIGVVNAEIGSSISRASGWVRYPLDITFAANYQPGRTHLHFGSFSQSGGNGGTQEDGPRTIFYGSNGFTIEDSVDTIYPRLIPETKRCP